MNEPGDAPLGLFGGTFDPLHIAHLRLAVEAREALGLSRVLFVPSGNPALRAAPLGTATDRLAMVQRAIADMPDFDLDSSEVLDSRNNSGPGYTVDTLRRLRRIHGPVRPLVLLLGADAFARLEAWYRWRELFELAHIAVATRPGHEMKVSPGDTALDAELVDRRGVAADLAGAPAGRIVTFGITAMEISATAIRRRLEQGLSVRYLVPDAVLDYIDSVQIYRTPHGH